jgi:hypothetical protein
LAVSYVLCRAKNKKAKAKQENGWITGFDDFRRGMASENKKAEVRQKGVSRGLFNFGQPRYIMGDTIAQTILPPGQGLATGPEFQSPSRFPGAGARDAVTRVEPIAMGTR